MKILLDTNIILDAITAREPFSVAAPELFLLAAQEQIEASITASSVTDIYYLARKSLSDDEAREAIRKLFQIFTVINVGRADCEAALDLPMDDYEDAIVAVCAKKAEAKYIVTRDERFLSAKTTPPTISPADFIQSLH